MSNTVAVNVQFKLIDAVGAPLKAINSSLKLATNGFTTLGRVGMSAMSMITKSMFSLKSMLVGGFFGYTGFNLLKNFSNQIIDVNKRLENTEARLKAIGSIQPRREALWILGFGMKNPSVAIKEIQEAFIKLKVAGIDPTNGSLKALVDTASALGLDNRDFGRMMLAISQMVGKGTVNSEELRQQLGEVVPTTMRFSREILGVDQAGLEKLVESGAIKSESFVPKLLARMGQEYRGATEAKRQTIAGIEDLMTKQMEALFTEIGQNGIIKKYKEIMNTLIDVMEERRSEIANIVNSLFEYIELKIKSFFEGMTMGEVFNLAIDKTRNGIVAIINAVEQLIEVAKELGVTAKAIRQAPETIMSAPSRFIDSIIQWHRNDKTMMDAYMIRQRINKTSLADINNYQEGKGMIKRFDSSQFIGVPNRMDGSDFSTWAKGQPNFWGMSNSALEKEYMTQSKELDYSIERIKRMNMETQTLLSGKHMMNTYINKGFAMNAPTAGYNSAYKFFDTSSVLSPSTLYPSRDGNYRPSNRYLSESDAKLRDVMAGFNRLSNRFAEERRAVDTSSNYDETLNNKDDIRSGYEQFRNGWLEAMKEVEEGFSKTVGNMTAIGKQAGTSIASAFADTFNTFFVDVIENRLESFKDYLLSFLKQIAVSASGMASNYITMAATSAIRSYMSPANNGMFYTDSFSSGGIGSDLLTGSNQPMMATMGGRGKAVINVQNNTGTPIEANQVSMQQDSSGMVMNVVLDNLARNKGGSRDAMRGLLR